MAGEKHLYLVAAGGYASSATAMANEIWQTGIRLLCVPGAQPDPIGPIDNTWDVVAASENRTEDDWTITSNWTIEAGVSDFNPADYLNDQAAPAFVAWLATTGLFSLNAQLRSLKLYPILAPTGEVIPAPPYAQGSPALLTFTGTLPVGATSGAMAPPNNSVVASMRTAQVGRRGRGRMFGPPHAAGVMGTAADAGTLPSAYRTTAATAYKTLLEALMLDAAGTGIWVSPIVTGAPFTSYALIDSVRIGNIVDGQTRRRAQLIEAYTSASVVQP